MNDGSVGEIQLENERFRVTRWTIAPGGAIPMHRHEYDYVVVPVMTGEMEVVAPDGSTFTAELRLGESYTRAAGAEHRIENRGRDRDVVFVEIERLA